MSVNVFRVTLALLLIASSVVASLGQSSVQPPVPSPEPVISPDVHPDNRVTFRLRDPNAKEVLLNLEGTKPVAMSKDAAGIWSYTTDPLQPDFYGYSFAEDGVELIDPSNQVIRPNLLHVQSEVHVPGPSSLPWEWNPVPHGEIHHHFYRSEIVGDDRTSTSTRRRGTIRNQNKHIRCCTFFISSATMRGDGPR